jgi:hypothetical protein
LMAVWSVETLQLQGVVTTHPSMGFHPPCAYEPSGNPAEPARALVADPTSALAVTSQWLEA